MKKNKIWKGSLCKQNEKVTKIEEITEGGVIAPKINVCAWGEGYLYTHEKNS